MHTVQVRLRRDAGLSEPEETPGVVTLATPFGPATLRGLPPGAVAALRALARGGTSEDELARTVTEHDGEGGLLRWHLLLRKLSAGALLERAVLLVPSGGEAVVPSGGETVPSGGEMATAGAEPVAVLRPFGGGPLRPAAPLAADARVRLSRFAIAVPEDGRLVVRVPRSPLGVELAPAAAPLLGLLADWTTPAGLACPGLPAETTAAVLGLFADAGLLVRPTPEGRTPSAAPPRSPSGRRPTCGCTPAPGSRVRPGATAAPIRCGACRIRCRWRRPPSPAPGSPWSRRTWTR